MTSVASLPHLWGYPVVLPKLRDPRLHLAAVIISIHILGQTVLDFRVTVPQILSAILASALLEIAVTFRRTRQLVWPASAMLTGSGVALILRVVGTERNEPLAVHGWYLFAMVAAVSLATKYLFTFRGSQLFNPSNVGLVAAFLLLGSQRVEPLDFWWAPLSVSMVLAYAIILGGGVLITSRLRLLAMGVSFWLALAVGLGLVASTGHCITAAWSLRPVCGFDFWQIVLTSPEVLVFLFFMITDPRTTPTGALPRVLFGAVLGILCALLMAPQSDEYGAKVALLGGLALLTPIRFLLERQVANEPSPRRMFRRGLLVGGGAIAVATTLIVAARPASRLSPIGAPSPINVDVDAASLPKVTVDPDVEHLNFVFGEGDETSLAIALLEDLAVEREARRLADPSLLRSVLHGARLVAIEDAIEIGEAKKERVLEEYEFESLTLDVVHTSGSQGGASLGLVGSGTVTATTLSIEGIELGRESTPFSATFVMAQPTGGRWMLVDMIEPS